MQTIKWMMGPVLLAASAARASTAASQQPPEGLTKAAQQAQRQLRQTFTNLSFEDF